jgi:hypothetical protein
MVGGISSPLILHALSLWNLMWPAIGKPDGTFYAYLIKDAVSVLMSSPWSWVSWSQSRCFPR